MTAFEAAKKLGNAEALKAFDPKYVASPANPVAVNTVAPTAATSTGGVEAFVGEAMMHSYIAAVKSGDVKTVKHCISQSPEIAYGKDATGSTGLHLAIQTGNAKMVEFLVSKGGLDVGQVNGVSYTSIYIVNDLTRARDQAS